MPEYLDIYDKNRNKTGRTWERGVPLQPGDWRMVIYAWLLNEKGEVLLTKRHPQKTWAGYWECTAGGVQAGETPQEAALRELREEIGIVKKPEDGILFAQGTDENHAFIDIWLFLVKSFPVSSLTLQDTEVVDAKWASREEFETMCRAGQVVPACKYFYQWLDEVRKES